MLSTIRQALLSTDFEESQLSAHLLNAGHSASAAALGVVIAAVVGTMRRDRRELRRWLTESGDALV